MSTRNIEPFLDELWRDYLRLNPQADKIHRMLLERGERIVNDHIALRTFQGVAVGLEKISAIFSEYGYKPAGQYDFPAKKLRAVHLECPRANAPRIFISELLTDRFSPSLREVVDDCLAGLSGNIASSPGFLMSGAPWSASHGVYRRLAAESEYAAWVYAHGFRPNHFTVSVNHLTTFRDLPELNQFLRENGIVLNSAGGEIKTSEYLDQSSTMAGDVTVEFREGDFLVPGCYYEFAHRRNMPDGGLFGGFVAKSADKIFESTNRGTSESESTSES